MKIQQKNPLIIRKNPSRENVSFQGLQRGNILQKDALTKSAPASKNVSFGATSKHVLDAIKQVKNANAFERAGMKLAKLIPDTFYSTGFFKGVTHLADKYPGLFEALVALGVTTTIRPATILAMPGAKKEDKQYAAVKSMASGMCGFVEATILFKPIGDIIEKLGKGHYKNIGIELPKAMQWTKDAQGVLKPTQAYKGFSFLVNYGMKFVFAVPLAILTFKLIPVFMDKLFPNRKKKPMDHYNPPIAAAKLSDQQRMVYEQFIQGIKQEEKGV